MLSLLMEKMDVTLGVDIGGTNTAIGLVDRQRQVVIQKNFPTQDSDPIERYFQRFIENVRSLQVNAGTEFNLVGAGIGALNANYYRGMVEYPPNLQWKGVTPVTKIVNEMLHVPVVITNDANAVHHPSPTQNT